MSESEKGWAEIPLTQGFVALVDRDDYEALAGLSWYARRTLRRYYAVSQISGRKVYMHRMILGPPDGVFVDHRHHHPPEAKIIDNRRRNLRLANCSGNSANSTKQATRSSPFKGVSWNKLERKWKAYVGAGCAREHLGTYRDEAIAALAYDCAAVRRFGEFAHTNFPVPGSKSWRYGPEILAAQIEARGRG